MGTTEVADAAGASLTGTSLAPSTGGSAAGVGEGNGVTSSLKEKGVGVGDVGVI
jgi:hypothetical protein